MTIYSVLSEGSGRTITRGRSQWWLSHVDVEPSTARLNAPRPWHPTTTASALTRSATSQIPIRASPAMTWVSYFKLTQISRGWWTVVFHTVVPPQGSSWQPFPRQQWRSFPPSPWKQNQTVRVVNKWFPQTWSSLEGVYIMPSSSRSTSVSKGVKA